MTNDPSGNNDADSIDEQAIIWVVKLTSGEVTAEEMAQFKHWRDADVRHQQALGDARQLWVGLGAPLGEPEQLARASVAAPSWVGQPLHVRRRSRLRPFAAAAVLLLAIGLGQQWLHNWRHSYYTPNGQQQAITLADNTRVWLNVGSAIDTDLRDGERHITLVRGEAFFDVTHDPSRPFVVDAGTSKVRVLGTAFAVRRDREDDVVVTVQRGRVRVSGGPAGSDSPSVDLVPNQQARVSRGASGPQVLAVNADQQVAWHLGRLVFENRTVAEVLHTLKRYDSRFVVADLPAVGNRKMTGMVDLNHLDAWYDGLGLAMPVTVTRVGPLVWLREKAATQGRR